LHLPDGFASGAVNAAGAACAAAAVGYSAWRFRRDSARRPQLAPLTATTAAFVFAAQMLNFPVAAGTSGHFLGAAAVAALLGPWSACLVMALVLVIQCLLFADGGVTALGTNILNMGLVAGLAGYALMRALRALLPSGRTGYILSAAAAGWAGTVAAAAACALELAASGTSPLRLALPAMAGVHAVIGVGEALITAAVLSAVCAARPDLLPGWAGLAPRRSSGRPEPPEARPLRAGDAVAPPVSGGDRLGRRAWGLFAGGALLAVVLAALVSPLASDRPDGLERVAADQGFEARAEGHGVWKGAPLPDYEVPGVAGAGPATGLAGLAGVAAVFAAGYVAIRLWTGRAGAAGRRTAG